MRRAAAAALALLAASCLVETCLAQAPLQLFAWSSVARQNGVARGEVGPAPNPNSDFTIVTNASAIVITGYTGLTANVVLPSTINGLPVVSLGYRAFYNKTAVTNVVISSSVTNVGDECFRGVGVVNAVLPDTVLFFGNKNYYYNTKVASVRVSKSLTRLLTYAIAGCTNLSSIVGLQESDIVHMDEANTLSSNTKLYDLSLPHGLVTLNGASTFFGSVMTNVFVPHSVTNMESSQFWTCTNLRTVVIGSNVAVMGPSMYSGCTRLTHIYYYGDAPSIPNTFNFLQNCSATSYYQAGKSGWDAYPGPTNVWVAP